MDAGDVAALALPTQGTLGRKLLVAAIAAAAVVSVACLWQRLWAMAGIAAAVAGAATVLFLTRESP